MRSREVANEILPNDMGYAWNGLSYQQSVAGGGAGVFALSLVLVFLILTALYESWSLPFSVFLSVPVAYAAHSMYGATLGGNGTMFGSSSNIVAAGICPA